MQVRNALPHERGTFSEHTHVMVLAEGEKVVVRGKFHGIHRGPFAGIEPTGKSVSAGLIVIYRIANGRIVDHWMQFDLFALLQQLQDSSAVQAASM